MTQNSLSEDDVKVKTSFVGLFVHLWPYFMRQKIAFFSTVAAVVGLALAGRLAVTLFGYAIDHGILADRVSVLATAALAYLILEIVRSYLLFLHGYLFAKIGNQVLFELRDELILHTQSLPISFFDKTPSGRIVTRVTNDVVSLGELFTQGLITVFSSFVSMSAIIVAMMLISVEMTLITLLIAPPLVWIALKLSQKILVVQRESKRRLANINAFVAENISGMRILQLYGRTTKHLEKFRQLSSDYQGQQLKSVRLYALLWPTVSFFNATSVAVALALGGWLTLKDVLTTGAMIAFILHTRDFIEPLRTILEKYQIFQNSLSGAERIFTLLGEEPEREFEGNTSVEGKGVTRTRPQKLRGQIEFEKLGFRYAENLPNALTEICLQVQPGESLALVGRTGSGKSTMIALLQRFYAPTEGRLLIDGQDIQTLPNALIRRRIGVVQQDTFLFRGTVADNIGLGDPSISETKIKEAAKQTGLTHLLRRHGEELSVHVEERGANLSLGERQLIAFARILAFDPDVLILDEATANIDSQSERVIQEATKKVRKGRTSLIIAHRISTVIDCDRIAVLESGRLIDVGSHRELIGRDGIYRKLCQSQFQDDARDLASQL